jgi:hypothetical protein
VIPPIRNIDTKPIANQSEVVMSSLPPQMVAVQPNTLMPVGTAITIVVIMKNIRSQAGVPLVNIWCAQTIRPRKAIA